ncbi:glyoxalase [Mycolicibacterium sp. S2-37]|nr:glyoxalase [Mycolicibacterium sp. S2-37]
MLPCVAPDETVELFNALGFQTTYQQTRPYLYLSFCRAETEIHYGRASKNLDPAEERSGGCLVMVDDQDTLAGLHREFTAALRAHYGKVLASGRPRMTRFRAGQTRFTVVDPSGNSVIFISRDDPAELEYGGSSSLTGLAKVIDNARILRDFKTDLKAAARVLDIGLRRHRAGASARDLARALAARAELAVALDDRAGAREIGAELQALDLTDDDRVALAGELSAADELDRWLSD